MPYEVSYSERVREELRALIARAKNAGLVDEVLSALKGIEKRLRLYPQFGQPLWNLSVEPAQMWMGVVAPLVIQYVLDESRRQVMVVHPITPLRNSGL